MGNTEVVARLRGLLVKVKDAVAEGDDMNKDIDLHAAVLDASDIEFDEIREELSEVESNLEQIIEDVDGD
ncbi:hypothetical protein LCGC14_0401860 [marine sediment metagenome]|uniref:Uncharacterized protein n=1 Tax=marine sediment metagenome TaxID=412755 RepID=A0A0F9W5T4_9ZZZZ